MKTIYLFLSLIIVGLPSGIVAQIKPRGSSQAEVAKIQESKPDDSYDKKTVKSPAVIPESELVVLEIDKRDIYITLEGLSLSAGSFVDVMAPAGYFIHPISKKRIQKQAEPIARLTVESVYQNYALCKALDWDDVAKIKKGMTVVPVIEEKPLEEVVAQPVVEELTKEEILLQAIDMANSSCPRDAYNISLDSFQLDNRVLVVNHTVSKKPLYNSIKKQIKKESFIQ